METGPHWLKFLEDGYFTPEGCVEPVFDVNHLSEEQGLKLRDFLERDEDAVDSFALIRLRSLLCGGEEGQHP